MPYYVYILKSESSGRYYCGSTENPEKRLEQHNDLTNWFTKTTKRFKGPWKFFWITELGTRSDAINLEQRIKKRGSKRFLDDLQI